jgi:Glycosyl hydrolases family 16/Domain of unknown function (DUF4214)
MSQAGDDVLLDLGGGETLTFVGAVTGQFTEHDFELPMNLAGFQRTFDDEFTTFSASPDGLTTTWRTTAATLSNEAEHYASTVGAGGPFSLNNGILDIAATPVSSAAGLPYTSGEITTQRSFAQTYGYFEMRAELPAGQGMWPAFWLLPVDGSSPPELDVMEMLGNDPSTIYTTTHSQVANTTSLANLVANTSMGFHTYGVDWEPDRVTFYFDANAISSLATPADMNKPMYMIVNLGVGGVGSWPGAATGESGHMLVDYVRAYASPTAIARDTPPLFTGLPANQSGTDTVTFAPFGAVAVSVLDNNAATGAGITLSSGGAATDADGILSGPGLTKTGIGMYSLAATGPISLGAELRALAFISTAHQVAPGHSVATSFDLTVTDGSLTSSASTILTTTATGSGSVVTQVGPLSNPTTPTVAVPQHGSHDQFIVASDNGSLHVEEPADGRDETQMLSSGNVITFSDGTGVFDRTGTAEDVDRLYAAALGRAPDVGGLEFWTSTVDDSHVSLTSAANSFAASPEFIHKYGSLSDPGFVQQLYQNVLNRPGEASGVQFWQGALASGTSRGAVLLSFAEGPENQAKTLSTAGDENNAEAYRLYQAALDRTPDQAGVTYWASALGGGATPTQLAQGFISSPEFQQKYGSLSASDFVSQLYQNVLHRAGDPGGQQFWTAQLQQGASQVSVLVGFSDGLENRMQTAGATHANWVFIPS